MTAGPIRPRAVDRLVRALSGLPGIGPKTSERLAYHVLRAEAGVARELADALLAARASTRVCSRCFNLDETDPCRICEDATRDRSQMLVVEDPRDVSAFEAAGHRGLYHVLQGRLSALEGILPGERTHVHLASELDSKVGKRANVDMMIEVSPDKLRSEGLSLWTSSNGVILCRRVPPSCIVGLTVWSAKAKASSGALRSALGLV